MYDIFYYEHNIFIVRVSVGSCRAVWLGVISQSLRVECHRHQEIVVSRVAHTVNLMTMTTAQILMTRIITRLPKY